MFCIFVKQSQFKFFNEENLLVANDLETLLELIENAGYRVEIIEEEEL